MPLNVTDLSSRTSPVHMMRARLSIEPALAREAAINASDEAVKKLEQARKSAEAAMSWDAYEKQDDAFHRCLAEATDNVLLLALFDQLNQVRRAVAWNNVVRSTERPPADHSSFKEHQAIAEACRCAGPGKGPCRHARASRLGLSTAVRRGLRIPQQSESDRLGPIRRRIQ